MIAVVLAALALAVNPPDAKGPQVDPADLTKRPELLGRLVTVEDRVKLYLQHRGRWDEVVLMRTPVRFLLQSPLAEVPDRSFPVRVSGILTKPRSREGREEYICRVSQIQALPEDKERLDKAVEALGPKDADGRWAWAAWAAERGADFQEDALRKRADDLRSQAIKIEAERPATDHSAHWLSLAEKARSFGLNADAGALAHRAFHARLAEAKSAADFERLAREIAAAVPRSREPTSETAAKWLPAYQQNPYGTYLAAPDEARAVLDRRLLADALEKKFDLMAVENPKVAVALAEKARLELPDRPEVARRLGQAGLEAMVHDVALLKQDEVETLAKTFEDQGQPGRAKEIKRAWLDDRRRNFLDPRDVSGRISQAQLYISMLGDRATADVLLREAFRIEPNSKALRDTLLRLGYKVVGDKLVSPDNLRSSERSAEGDSSARRSDDPLIGLTRAQVKNQLGEPKQTTRLVTQGFVVEQWTYDGGKGGAGVRCLNFARAPGQPEATVQRHFVQP